MEFKQLEEEIEKMSAAEQKVYREILALSSLGGDILPIMKDSLEKANSLREFLDLVYMDDACRFEKAWAVWAKYSKKMWLTRFDPECFYEAAVLERGGVVLESERVEHEGEVLEHGGAAFMPSKNMMLIPVRGTRAHDRTIDLFVYPDDGFNTDLGEYYGSITGCFTCYGLELKGSFDIYRCGRALVFERWTFNELGYRAKKKSFKGACECCLQ